jgi:hypothetical protein
MLWEKTEMVPPMIKMKTQGAKNKVCKPQGAIRYLTLKNK